MKVNIPVAVNVEEQEVSENKEKRVAQKKYRAGGEGCIKWIEDFCFAPVYEREETEEGMSVSKWVPFKHLSKDIAPSTGRSYWMMWSEHKEILRKALEMENGRFKYRIIVFCWQRGEGKSLLACLVQLWKFFNFGRQQIMLGANSKDQIKFVHFDIMRDIILNSPKLLAQIGKANVHEKEIRLKDGKGNVRSILRAISSFTGIVSNITGYTFSEIFAMKKPTFFVQLDGSVRNMPNALGIIDSTVSDKLHILYKLYQNAVSGKSKRVFFSYRYSKNGDQRDYLHPFMDDEQLNEYRINYPFGEFERYFLNTWEAGSVTVFTEEMREEINMIGYDGLWFNHDEIQKVIAERNHAEETRMYAQAHNFADGVHETQIKIDKLKDRFLSVEKEAYSFEKVGGFGSQTMIDVKTLDRLTEKLDTYWSLSVGLDMADPLAVQNMSRTVLSFVVKGLPHSRSDSSWMVADTKVLRYVYFLVGLYNIESNDLDHIKRIVGEYHEELNGIDAICFERFAAWDMVKWCEERDIEFTPIFPNYEKQREAFKEFYMLVKEGRFKSPPVPVVGSKSDDLLQEEMSVFYHNLDERWFGSPEKKELYGIKDDAMYSIAWGLYGSRLFTPSDFRIRTFTGNRFGTYIPNKELSGSY